ncbi:putative 2-oxoglutarate-dependent dioxygenase AOP1 [Prunus yedoensis var. nudiflora]|uniref:Putative 2-oxoglutarate-dependent dioxygenase AOP1 n=1 Tax=Prunus yedoensis var. nudiflora TaxID=2094558 RepID=A0A314XNH8_PRUYE|nr:putative 2-oxoglutarate-dependent dioxygenase AOP1 [Prunus yedoensis var. nudiflora]
MGSLTVPTLPTINFSIEDLKPGSASWLSTAKQVRFALEEYGSFVAQYDQISAELLNNMFGQAKDLFEVPKENKVKNVGEEPYRGHMGPSPGLPLYESLCIDNVTSPQETQKFKNLMWPEGKSNFCETTDSFGQLLAHLERTVEQLMFESYGIGKQYESVGSSNGHLLRFIRYTVPEDKDATVRFPSHTDINFTTIVVQHDIAGLEIKTKEGDWINVECAPSQSQFVFMAGDGLQVWSNDRVKACHHRVKHCGNKTRYSIGLFTFNNGIFQVPEELVDESHPLLYNAFDSRAFIRKYATTPELKKEASPIKAFAGVKA